MPKYSTNPIPVEDIQPNIVTNPIPLDRILSPEEIEELEREEYAWENMQTKE